MNKYFSESNDERGMALITSLLATTILLALGMAVVLSATTDTVTTKAQRVGEQSFFVADAGVGIARRAMPGLVDQTKNPDGVPSRFDLSIDARRNPGGVDEMNFRIPGVALRATTGLRRARAGKQRTDVGAARLAAGTDLLAHADAVDGRVLPRLHRGARRVVRP